MTAIHHPPTAVTVETGEDIPVPRGYLTHVANVGIKDDTTDFSVLASEGPCGAAAVFTKSRFAGPSVVVSRRRDRPGRASRGS